MTIQDKKQWVMVASAVSMLMWAATLTTVGFAIKPPGEIHDSVLWVLGQAFLYAGGIFGINEAGKISARREVDRQMREYERRHNDGLTGLDGDTKEDTDVTEETDNEDA